MNERTIRRIREGRIQTVYGEFQLTAYREHAETDPRHGKDWLDRVVEPLATDPSWARRMADGALWRHAVNDRFFRWWQQEQPA